MKGEGLSLKKALFAAYGSFSSAYPVNIRFNLVSKRARVHTPFTYYSLPSDETF